MSRIAGVAGSVVAGFMNERRRVQAAISWHADEDNNNDDDNYHQQLKKAKWPNDRAELNEHQSSLGDTNPPPPSSPLTLRRSHHQRCCRRSLLPPRGTKLSGVRGSLRPDKMLQNDRDNNDNEFHVSQSWRQRCLAGLTAPIKLLQVQQEMKSLSAVPLSALPSLEDTI